MEIITGVERRRRWRCEEKLRIVAEVERPWGVVQRRSTPARGDPGSVVELAASGA